MIDHHTALIYTMVMVSASDADMTDAELNTISETVRYLPVFRDFDPGRMTEITADCTELLGQRDGLDAALAEIKRGLPAKLRETAYAVACDVAAADGYTTQEELRLLELLRDSLEIDRLNAAAIERGARARHMVL
ncbi:Tellurite resistance protein TerB [Skermanella stibiiresistens SB22]|jgi:tellurite resistance protein|uniref:Tellurite resistance protein TerB n=1 Tax=Skermanella stibiiresistens SB22 TaxID=1385369 RepID=W9H4U2_9PROT|nr:tellurite resistance TerB family protein [Skermanella stibiiresistens]EWY39712.1 Tellurite resistance protein TerB [Skermanella stibiiresistens SB22]